MSSPQHQAGSPETVSIEKRDDVKLEDGYPIAPVLTLGQLSMAHDVATTVPDERETKRLIRKMDWRVLPICSILYLFSFLDRGAIGNARTLGMNVELKLTASQYAAALSIFFLLYGLLEVPSNIILKKIGAKKWIPTIVLPWGIVMMVMGFSKNFATLFALRMLLGGFEAGLFPGISYLLTDLYPRNTIQLRIGIFFSAVTIAGAFGGALAAGFAKVSAGNYQGWSLIFIFEGILTILVGIVAYFVMFDGIPQAKFLNEQEKNYLEERVRFDGYDVPMNDEFHWEFVRSAFYDWKTLFTLVTYVCTIVPLYSIALTLPAILRTVLKYPPIASNLLTVPVYTVAAVVVLTFAFLSDKLQNRTMFIVIGNIVSVIGWTLSHFFNVSHPWVAYGGYFIGAAGAYGGFPGVIACLTQNCGGKTKRSRKQRMIDSGEAARLTKDQISDLSDASPFFRYRY